MNNPQFKPTDQELDTIKQLYESGTSFDAIAARYGYARHVIQKIAKRSGWSRVVATHWTEEKKEEFKRLYATGMPHSEIARTLGVTKDACLSLRKRMRLPERKLIKNDVPERPAPFLIVEPQTPRPDHGVLIWDLQSHHCRWPIHGEPDEHMIYCGEPKEEGCSYCAKHVAASKPHAFTESERTERANKLSNFYLRRMSHVGG